MAKLPYNEQCEFYHKEYHMGGYISTCLNQDIFGWCECDRCPKNTKEMVRIAKVDILIRGMEMPTDGGYLDISIHSNGIVVVPEQVHIPGTPHEGPIRYQAISLPAGHGRCIDADALIQKLLTRKDGSRRNDRDSDGWPNLLEVETVRTAIEEASTIVPAEGSGEDGE